MTTTNKQGGVYRDVFDWLADGDRAATASEISTALGHKLNSVKAAIRRMQQAGVVQADGLVMTGKRGRPPLKVRAMPRDEAKALLEGLIG